MIELPDTIYRGMRVLFKEGHGWEVGELNAAELGEFELTFSVVDIDGNEHKNIQADKIFFNSRYLELWEQQNCLYTKEEFILCIKAEQLSAATHNAWMSDGEYVYYSVGRWNENWINKQPLEYVLCE